MAIELNYACAECVQLKTNWSLAYNFLLTQLSRFSQNVLS